MVAALLTRAGKQTYSTMQFTYKEAVEKIMSLQTNASILEQLRKAGPRMNDRSLPEMREYLKRIGYKASDFDQLNVIHVTGTKGKGSTCALTQSILHHYPTDRPIRTGLFTSPHLVAIRERIRIDGKPLSEELFAKYSQDVWERLESTKEEALAAAELEAKDYRDQLRDGREHPDKPTYFRYLTLVAFHAFMQEKVDVAILEVGVGGEYDSTNVIERPIVCGITALGLDHVSVLGDTIDKIAWHKAGIIKPGVPAIAFEQPKEAMAVIEQRAKEKKAPLTFLHPQQTENLKGVSIGLAGLHQKYNALTAIELCRAWLKQCRNIVHDDAVPAEFLPGLAKVTWPGRGQRLSIEATKYASRAKDVTWYLDGAHTVESLGVCAEWFQETVKDTKNASRVLVFNCTNGRDGAQLLEVMARLQSNVEFDHVVFSTNITFREGYAPDSINNTTTLKDILHVQKLLAETWTNRVGFSPDRVHIVGSIQEAVEWVVDYAQSQPVQVLTTGSLILVGNTLTALGIPPQ